MLGITVQILIFTRNRSKEYRRSNWGWDASYAVASLSNLTVKSQTLLPLHLILFEIVSKLYKSGLRVLVKSQVQLGLTTICSLTSPTNFWSNHGCWDTLALCHPFGHFNLIHPNFEVRTSGPTKLNIEYPPSVYNPEKNSGWEVDFVIWDIYKPQSEHLRLTQDERLGQ